MRGRRRLRKRLNCGFVFTELLVAGLISAFLMLGLVQMAAGASRGLLLIESLSQTQQGGRFAITQMRDVVMAAGFDPLPWQRAAALQGLGVNSSDGGGDDSDGHEHSTDTSGIPSTTTHGDSFRPVGARTFGTREQDL